MPRFPQRFVLVGTASALVVALGVVAWALATGSSEAQTGSMRNCPAAGRWAIAVWEGENGVEASQALATCGENAVSAAYYLDPQTGGWLGWFPGRPDISKLVTLNNLQGIIALGSAAATGPGPAPGPAPPTTSIRRPAAGWAGFQGGPISAS